MPALLKQEPKKSLFTFIFHPQLLKINQFKPKIVFELDKGDFIIKTAENPAELRKALELRHEVFYEELLHKKKLSNIDIDKFDFICDHLLIIEKATQKYIGTYRLNASRFSNTFYSETEFDISNILKLKDHKLELGRACIDKDYRNGVTITLLWAGISEYLKLSESRYLFGCSSIKTTDHYQIASVFKFLKDTCYSDESTRVYPKKKFQIKDISSYADFLGNVGSSYDPVAARKLIPSLLKSYIKAGAKICGEPALDKDFQCIDCFTLLDMQNLKETVMKKFC